MAKREITKYNDAEIERALQALVLEDGKPSRAVERLEALGTPVPLRTMQHWRNSHSALYDRLVETRSEWNAERQAEHSEQLADLYAAGEAKLALSLINRDETELHDLSPNVVAMAARSLATARGISIDKANLQRGRPTSRTEERNLADILRAIASNPKFAAVFENPELIESSATELPPSASEDIMRDDNTGN